MPPGYQSESMRAASGATVRFRPQNSSGRNQGHSMFTRIHSKEIAVLHSAICFETAAAWLELALNLKRPNPPLAAVEKFLLCDSSCVLVRLLEKWRSNSSLCPWRTQGWKIRRDACVEREAVLNAVDVRPPEIR
jgi:hypothetical protein